MPVSPGADGRGGMSKNGVLVLPTVPKRVPGLHRPLPVLQIPHRLRHLGTVPPGGQKAVQGGHRRRANQEGVGFD